jgi:hypothetical protein
VLVIPGAAKTFLADRDTSVLPNWTESADGCLLGHTRWHDIFLHPEEDSICPPRGSLRAGAHLGLKVPWRRSARRAYTTLTEIET